MTFDKEKALEAMRKYFGFSDFRPGQWDSMAAILEGRDAVVLMPTGQNRLRSIGQIYL